MNAVEDTQQRHGEREAFVQEVEFEGREESQSLQGAANKVSNAVRDLQDEVQVKLSARIQGPSDEEVSELIEAVQNLRRAVKEMNSEFEELERVMQDVLRDAQEMERLIWEKPPHQRRIRNEGR